MRLTGVGMPLIRYFRQLHIFNKDKKEAILYMIPKLQNYRAVRKGKFVLRYFFGLENFCDDHHISLNEFRGFEFRIYGKSSIEGKGYVDIVIVPEKRGLVSENTFISKACFLTLTSFFPGQSHIDKNLVCF